jgi:hypothetical protein
MRVINHDKSTKIVTIQAQTQAKYYQDIFNRV